MSYLDDPTGSVAKLRSFAKLTIRHETTRRAAFDGTIETLFDPSQLRYDNRAEWCATGTVARSLAGGFQRPALRPTLPATLSLDLFFHTHEGAPASGPGGMLDSQRSALDRGAPTSPGTSNVVDVRRYSDPVVNLTHVQPELHRPPLCCLQWGRAVLFEGVLTQLHQDFTCFLSDGTPVRATLGCTFTAYRTFDQAVTAVEHRAASVTKRRIVRRGETLISIATEEYNDAGCWREIAQANGIDHPRAIMPGQVLVIPRRMT
jgi:hypothetical protein